ncbi:MAG TPA: hypothetical protein VMQ62_02490, partial [Dongiaceae bacterium]|nr:hypothetical protein [Dongiaceae bacterium]
MNRPGLLVALSRYPATRRYGSAILIRDNLESLSQRFDLHLVCRGDHPVENDLAAFCRTTEFLGREYPLIPKPLRRPLRLFSGLPPVDYGLRSPRVRARLDSLMATGGFEALLVYDQASVQYVPAAWAARTVVCIEDAQSIRQEALAALPVWTTWQRLRLRAEARQMRRYERRVLPP